MDFKNLKKNSGKTLGDLTKKLEEETKKTTTFSDKDPTFWLPTLDKVGNGSAVIRFLPTPPQDGEDGSPWIKYFHHSFQGPGGWYIEKSLTSIGKADPLAELNSALWNTKIKANEERARKQKRKLAYVSNIEVIADPAKPENNGKVFKFRYGAKIWGKFEEAMAGDEGDEVTQPTPGFDPFDFWEGANFRLKVTRQGEFPNYDDSKFGPRTPHRNGDDKILETVWKSQYSLKAVIAEDQFKTYEKLKERLDKVLAVSTSKLADDVEAAEESIASRKTAETTKVTRKVTVKEEDNSPPWETNEPDPKAEEDLAYFQGLVDC